MSNSDVLDPEDTSTSKYIITHVICPLHLPDGDDHSIENDHSLARAIATTAHIYNSYLDASNKPLWQSISRMLDNLRDIVQLPGLDRFKAMSQLRSMNVGDVATFFIRAQNVAVVFRKQQSITVFEAFEISPKAESIMATPGKLICSYPGPAIEVPNTVFDDENFLVELINFLIRMNEDVLQDAVATTRKAQSVVPEERDTTHPRYITELLTGILRSVGRPAEVSRIAKRIGDDVVWNNSKLPWRRSSLWLLIRVVLQTTLERSAFGRAAYKEFTLFFICCLGKKEICVRLPNDLLQSTLAKISRRSLKLGSSVPDWLSRIALETCTSLRSILEQRWIQAQTAHSLTPSWAPSDLDFSQDIQLSLLNSKDHIRNRLVHCSVDSLHADFRPGHRPRGSLDDFLSTDGAFFNEGYRTEPNITLFDVERAVEQGIDGWVDRALLGGRNEACVKLELLANNYSSGAVKTYENNPELLSIMLLTMIELWIALDRIAVREITILAEYSPEVPASLLENPLLCKAAGLNRLRRAHQYITNRHSQARRGSVFNSTVSADSFAIRFFGESSRLQQLKSRIEEAARREKSEKAAEVERANTRHRELGQEAGRIEHSYYTDWRGYWSHSYSCRKCDLERQQSNMRIDLHEWPLPAERLQAELVVFELDCPVSFDIWRTATSHLLVDICSPSNLSHQKSPYITLSNYGALGRYFNKHARSRISLASDSKPFVVSHYRDQAVPTSQNAVCVNNGLIFYCFDSRAGITASSPLGQLDVEKYCTYQLQNCAYEHLQKYLTTTLHTSNEILANQADCHKDLSIHEFVVFGHLRSGGVLQWLNVLRELRGRSLSFRRHDVHFLIAQAISQVGPLGNTGWTWHQEIQETTFCDALLAELENLIQDVKANWLEVVTMDTVSFLLRRLLASGPSQAVSQNAVKLLRIVRRTVFDWVMELTTKLTRTPEDEEFRGSLRDCAAICRGTFDVEPPTIHDLFSSAEDVDIFISSSILIHDHTPTMVSSLSTYSKLLLDRDMRLSLALETVVHDLIETGPGDRGTNLAIVRFWRGYRPGSNWSFLPSPNSRWLSCTTAAEPEQRSQVVHFNLLDGSLLVDGKPLGRLPSEITHHPLYNLIFSGQVLDVIPSDIAGMDYATRGVIFDHQVYFSLVNGSDLVIRAKKRNETDSSETMELVPQEKFEGDLPAVLIDGHAHWLNLSTSRIEVRPLDTIWKSSQENWSINCTPGQYRMQRGHDFLIDIRSPSWAMVSDILRPLDTPRNLIIKASRENPVSPFLLSVDLSRYGLSFYIDKDKDLQSRDIRGMVYDENQCIRTLFGLVNRLVLRPKSDAAELTPRLVIVPEGKISFKNSGHHVQVKIHTQRESRVTYQTYRVDQDMGCLATGSLTNKLYCAYLHALTSGCGVDLLTGRSGTEEALSVLQSASCWSIMRVDPRDVELLCLIASLCPSRTWYPEHLKCMQQVEWLDLPVLSQHHRLHVVTASIKAHYEKLLPFYEGHPKHTDKFKEFPSQDVCLLERSAQREMLLFSSVLSLSESSSNPHDAWYTARDLMGHDSGEQRAYAAAAIVNRRAPSERITKNILSTVESWSEIVSGDATLSLQYDRSWLAPDLSTRWIKLYNLLRTNDEAKWYQLLFTLPAMAYASTNLSDLIPILVAFASHYQFRSENPPNYTSYDLSLKYHPCQATLRRYVADSAYSFDSSPESSESARYNESPYELSQRRLGLYHARLNSDTDATVGQLTRAWPCETPPTSSLSHNLYSVGSFTSNVQSHFASCYHNLKLKEHLERVQRILYDTPISSSPPNLVYSFNPSRSTPRFIPWMIALEQLFSRPRPSLQSYDRLLRYVSNEGDTVPSRLTPLSRVTQNFFDIGFNFFSKFRNSLNLRETHVMTNSSKSHSGSALLRQLIDVAGGNLTNRFQNRYISALRTSAECFGRETSGDAIELPGSEVLVTHYNRCRDHVTEMVHHLQYHLRPMTHNERVLEKSGQWPRITPFTLLRLIAANSPISIHDDWIKCLTELALLMLELQRSRRLLRLHRKKHREELRKELQNEGCDGWSAEMHPDWLLAQLQGDFFIRRVQAEVADEMISPCSGENTAMQLNMGEGKSSVIVPIVVSALADGNQLVRVIVPKALTAQMFRLLVDRLGRLVDRRIYFLPFSRSIELNRERVTALYEIMSECMRERGILVVQPEHILSLRLVSVEKQLPDLYAKDRQVGDPLLDLQRWLHSHSRDILDESDEILHARYQLVYTIGNQRHLEGFPERWTTTQQILHLVRKHASSLRNLFPLGAEYSLREGHGSFPHLRILHDDAGRKLISLIMQDIVDDLLPNFSFAKLRPDLKGAIRNLISCEHVSNEEVQLVKAYSEESTLWHGILLLRGLLATGILLFAFKERRWRVDYGLSLSRTMLAVPYRAKDVPAQRAEFGHPDVAIVLTCLSYYYGGLTGEQLQVSFDILLKQDNPITEYELWVRECSSDVPISLRTLSGINLKSLDQWHEHLYPLFSRNKAAVDFYLSRVVFPKEAKEFPSKLSCSGWDLAEKRNRLVTGFSGTNDGQYLLPLHITQRDPDHQRGTNAKVLSYLLQPENNHYMCMAHENRERQTTREFLSILVSQKPEIRVLLDVGAQMLELENRELVQTWLNINSAVSAAIYFNEQDELTVLTRDGRTQLLSSSPFEQQLDQCVVYLDDAHTRGTDIKFPTGFRAAVTLGPKVTKDRLAQGCMRMRKLGHGQSIMFFAPLEIDQHIRTVAKKCSEDNVGAIDILHWAIHETCNDILQRAPHWAQQGTDHTSRYATWTGFCADQLTRYDLLERWLQPEAKTLENLYGPRDPMSPALKIPWNIRQRCEELGILSLRDVSMDEEQEREVIHEVEREQQVERPPKLLPATHSLHNDVSTFIQTGIIPSNSTAFRPAVETLDRTTEPFGEAHIWSPYLLTTQDFETAVSTSGKVDDYLRPVQWIVSGHGVLVILSPYEANCLIPTIKASNKIHLHLYTPRVTQSAKSCDGLMFYNIPTVPTGWTVSSLFMDQLNLFSGQLYFEDYEAYIRTCRFLCVYARDLEGEGNIEVDYNGFIAPRHRPTRLQSASAFQSSPLPPLKSLIGFRRKGMHFALTPMGKLLDGRLLSRDDFVDCLWAYALLMYVWGGYE